MSPPDEIAALIAQTEAADRAWVNGLWEDGYGALISPAEDVTIFGPFGGPAARGTAWSERAAKAVTQFRNGSSSLKLVSHHKSGDLIVLVMVAEQKADIAGQAAQPWSLRLTQVYRREHGAWKVVHRHADPLVASRTIEYTLELASGPK
jgi:ketosteroid isomerase-like protein